MRRVSIVVPAYNAERWLGETLDSVLAGQYQDFEIVVVDDGSRDATAAVAQARGAKVRVLRQANAGMSAARNAGIAASTGEFVALLDADDLWHPHKLALQVAALDAHPDVGLCYSEFFSWDGLQPMPASWASDPGPALDERLSGFVFHLMVLTNFVLPSSAVFRRSLLHELGPFLCEDHQTDDWEYLVRASRLTPFAKLAAPLVAYRQTPGSLSRQPRLENVTELMRERLITQYGLTGPDGRRTDTEALAWRRYKGCRDHADTNLAHGSARAGLRSFAQLLLRGPRRASTLRCIALSLRKRLGRRMFRLRAQVKKQSAPL